MLPNPFSEEDAQRYIAEFKSWPHEFPPDQLVYAGFRSEATPSAADRVTCYGCNLELSRWRHTDNALEEHLKRSPACPIVLKIQQSKLERAEEIKQTTLAQLDRQMEIRRQSAKNALAESLQQECLPHVGNTEPLKMMKEARLLHFYRDKGNGMGSSQWYLSNYNYGTQVLPSDGSVHYVDVVIEKMDTGTKGDEMKGDEMQPESETTSEGIPTPGTSVVDGQ
ncbi:MAG: hypothetical protein L6R36_003076 [Xanthoria steineri]|nr:MAG: hypothetical protein L6R36_003076 [Xanthoria steineri]